MTTTELREDIKLTGEGVATAGLKRLAGAADRVAAAFGHIGNVAGVLGGIGGVFKLIESVRATDQLYRAIGRVKAITGVAAADAHAMFDAFDMSGVEMEAAEGILTRLARQSNKFGGSVAASGKEAQELNRRMKALGVNIKSGPQEQLLQMSKAAQKGRLRINDLMAVFGIGRSQAAQVLKMLQGGPERLRAIYKDTKNSAAVIDDKTMESYENLQSARARLSDSWGDLVNILYKSLMPAVTRIVEGMANGMERIQPIVEKIGSGLANHMGLIVSLAKTFAGIMAGNKILNLFGGKGGSYDKIKGFLGAGMGFLGKFAPPKGPTYANLVGSTVAQGYMMAPGTGGIRLLSSSIGKIGVLGAVIAVVAKAFQLLATNAGGIRDQIGGLLGSIAKSFGRIFEAVKPLLKALSELFGGVITIAAKLLLEAFKAILWVIDKIAAMVAWVVDKIKWVADKLDVFGADVVSNESAMGKWARSKGIKGGTHFMIGKVLAYTPEEQAAIDAAKAAKGKADAAKRGVPQSGTGTVINQDFRGSKFDIQQNFAEGFDAGRIGVAFGDQLAAMGERQVDSGLRPVYSYR